MVKTEDLVASYMDWMTLSSTDEEFVDDISRTLKSNLKFYPEQSHIDAQCIALLKMGTEVSALRAHVSCSFPMLGHHGCFGVFWRRSRWCCAQRRRPWKKVRKRSRAP